MERLEFYGKSINERFLERAVRTLEAGGLVIFPPDSLYALGCDALNNRAIERLCRIKGINPEKQLLSVVCADISQAAVYARIDNRAFRLLRDNLPGPFTFILPASPRLPKAFKGRHTVGVRIPGNDVAQALAHALGRPLLASSVEIDDEAEAVDPESVAMHYDGLCDLILDAGPGGTAPSAVIDITDPDDPQILRPGPSEPAL